MNPARIVLLALVALSVSAAVRAQDLQVAPYVQLVTKTGAWILWETDAGDDSVVEWGLTQELGSVTEGSAFVAVEPSRIHEVELTGLEPDTVYHYRASTGDLVSPTAHFRTQPRRADVDAFRLVATSDMQQDGGNPEVWGRIVNDGILGYVADNFGPELVDELAMVLVPGDLVDDGWVYEEWAETFFAPAAALFAHVPVYPVPGNHEANTRYFFDYFHLPSNETEHWDEHWWVHDYGNLRIVGIDSNEIYRLPPQTDWLDGVLQQTCDDSDIDFLFAQFHHPAQSELWEIGEAGFSRVVVERLEEFSTVCGKPSIHFYGHTHGYARGQSRDHAHLWVNVATGGGAIDDWGEYPQVDYPETTVSQDEYGFVVVEVRVGSDAGFSLTRVGRGDIDGSAPSEVRDRIEVRLDNRPPDRPMPEAPGGDDVGPDCLTLRAGAYADSDGDAMMASHWQVATDCEFETVVDERWHQRSNWYFDVDTQEGDDLTDTRFEGLEGAADHCWRVRYRDEGLVWSAWSEPVRFRTAAARLTENLVVNPGAEEGIDGWSVEEGELESLEERECDGRIPMAGERYFAVGGLCTPTPVGRAAQSIDVSAWSAAIDGGAAVAYFDALLSDWNGADVPGVELVFRDEAGVQTDVSARLETRFARWERFEGIAAVPAGTRTIDVVLHGRREAGTGNDSYVDDVRVRLSIDGEIDCATDGTGIVWPEPADDAGIADAGTDADGRDADDSGLTDEAVDDTGADGGIEDAGAESGANGSQRRKRGCAVVPLGPPPALLLLLAALPVCRRGFSRGSCT